MLHSHHTHSGSSSQSIQRTGGGRRKSASSGSSASHSGPIASVAQTPSGESGTVNSPGLRVTFSGASSRFSGACGPAKAR